MADFSGRLATGRAQPSRRRRGIGAVALALAAVGLGAVAASSRLLDSFVAGQQAPARRLASTSRSSAEEAAAASRLILAATEVADSAVVTEDQGLIPGDRYIAMNRFQVRDGAEAQFEKRWASRKSSLMELEGFRWFGLFQRVPVPWKNDAKYDDDYNYVSFTIWQNKKNFNSWRTGPAFKEAHGGGGIFEFIGMIINGFLTSKGPPKPCFWHGMLLEHTQEEKPRLLSGPGGRPDMDGSKTLEPEVFVSMNRFSVAAGQESKFEQRWAQRESKLQSMPGFRFFQIMRRDQTPDDDVNYISMAVWDNLAAFENWRMSDSFRESHGSKKDGDKDEGEGKSKGPMGGILVKPPTAYFYNGKLVLESERGA